MGTRQFCTNIILCMWLLADAVRFFQFGSEIAASEVVYWGFGFAFLLCAGFVLWRPVALRQDISASAVIVAIVASCWPLTIGGLLPAAPISMPVLIMQGVALAVLLFAILTLRFNFSVLPQYRSITTNGPYAIVRHPLYSAYLLFDGALVCQLASWLGLGLWIAEGALFAWRAELEERLLIESDKSYSNYRTHVQYRFMPFVY